MNPILRDLPLHITTDRLLIRCPQPGDGVLVHQAVVETLADLRQWPASLPWAQFEPSVDASETFCREGHVAYLGRKHFPMLVFLKDGLQLVGSSGLHDVDWATPRCEVGYWGRHSFRGQGLITEAVRAIAQFAFHQLDMRRIVSLPDAANGPSCRVAERAGFVLEGTMRHERKAPDGTLRDTCLYALVR